jgi:thiamine transport system substrate-binding protein
VDAAGNSLTASILDGCFRQTEYVGVLKHAKNPDNARALVRFLLSKDFQQSFPTAMYMYPIDKSVALPDPWAKNTQLPTKTFGDHLDINTYRKDWLAEWSAIFE